MRFYLKIVLLIHLCVGWPIQRTVSDLAYDVRVGFVCAFGSAADYEGLIDDTQRMLARERGNLDLYLKGQRYRELLAQRIAAAARLHTVLNEDDLQRIQGECLMEAFGGAESWAAADIENEPVPIAKRSDEAESGR